MRLIFMFDVILNTGSISTLQKLESVEMFKEQTSLSSVMCLKEQNKCKQITAARNASVSGILVQPPIRPHNVL